MFKSEMKVRVTIELAIFRKQTNVALNWIKEKDTSA